MRSAPLGSSAASLIFAIAVPAQEPVDRDTIARIRDEGLQRSRVEELFSQLVDGFGPRLTASPAYNASARWARETLEEWGLQDAHLESFEFGRGWTLERFSLHMTAPRYLPLIGYPRAWSTSTDGVVQGTPVMVAGRSPDDVAGRLRGAIVLTRPVLTNFVRADREPPPHDPPDVVAAAASRAEAGVRRSGRGQRGGRGRRGGRRGRGGGAAVGADLLREAGAAVTLEPSRGEHGTMFVLGRDGGDDAVPAVVVATEHYNMIARMLEREIPVELEVEVRTRFHEEDTNGYNVLAEIPGSDPEIGDQVVMVGAHLDSWHSAPGATDNADGSAVAMEAMRILRALDVRPRRTIRIALWGGEEQGLHGSRNYVRDHLAGDGNRAARDRFSVYFNLDPGYGPIQGWFLEGNTAMYPIMRAWLEPLSDLGATVLTLRGIGSTDHLSFIREGLPGFQALHSYVDYDVRTHHTNVDTYERVDPGDLAQAAVVMASVLYHAAMRDEMIPRAPAVGRTP